jgi:hypothetical protein
VLIACAFVIERGQDQNWDLFSYHYFSGYSFLNGRFRDDLLPTSIQTYLNPLPTALTYFTYSRLAFPLSSLTLLAVQLLVIPALMLVGREIGKGLGHQKTTISEIGALALGLASPLWWSELGTSLYSSTTAPLIVFGVWLMLRAAASAPASRNVVLAIALSGSLFGFATALKLTNAVFLIAGLVALLPLFCRFGTRSAIGSIFGYLAGVSIGVATMAWWYLPIWREYGNPIFPLYNALFKSEYFDAVNYHDDRFAFRNVAEVIQYLGSSAFGTSKTSELEFADARLLLCAVLVLLVVARTIWTRERAKRQGVGVGHGSVVAVFLWFMAAGLATWALTFAYQRYLIPIELLLGFAVWVLLERLLEIEARVVAALGICLLLSISLIRIPNWGHRNPDTDATSNIFGLQLPEELRRGPAEYLIAGFPNAFILPFLHPESHFYRIDFSPRLRERIRDRLGRFRDRPVKLIAMKSSQQEAMEAARELGYQPADQCVTFRSRLDSYITCDMRTR